VLSFDATGRIPANTYWDRAIRSGALCLLKCEPIELVGGGEQESPPPAEGKNWIATVCAQLESAQVEWPPISPLYGQLYRTVDGGLVMVVQGWEGETLAMTLDRSGRGPDEAPGYRCFDTFEIGSDGMPERTDGSLLANANPVEVLGYLGLRLARPAEIRLPDGRIVDLMSMFWE
jgi:hypothetical protein